MEFEFSTAAKIIFGAGKLNSIRALIEEYHSRVLIVSGAPEEISDRLFNQLDLQGVKYKFIKIDQEPTVDVVREVVELARVELTSLLIGIGGGSALDTAKATAALVTNPGDITDYLEVIGLNKPLNNPSLPLIAIPTTSGTGSEVTRNAVIGSPTHHVKVSLRSPHLLPRIALVDPELTLSVPPSITAITGLDALTQLIEPFTCSSPNPLTDAFCLEGIQCVARSLFKAYDDGSNLRSREDMSLASLFSVLALANAKLGAVHGLAGSIGGEIPAHHGAICASLLPNVMAANISALINRSPGHPTLERYTKVGKLLSGDPAATADTAVQWVQTFCQHANIQPLSFFGLTETHFSKIIEKALKASSMKGNPITLTEDELRNILQRSL
jgi:alcohol dehydrogenase class IV